MCPEGTAGAPADLNQLLHRWSAGDRNAFDELITIVYSELRKLARHHIRNEAPGRTLQTTALVNEAYLRLARQHKMKWQSQSQFYGVASQIMRRILVDGARERHAAKRGDEADRVPLDDASGAAVSEDLDLLALDRALDELSGFDRQKARIIEMRYFGGLSVEETARMLGVSATTVKRDWVVARAWLFRRLSGADPR
jgi:RNA polymerase sigma factor (TIGR02999 family)